MRSAMVPSGASSNVIAAKAAAATSTKAAHVTPMATLRDCTTSPMMSVSGTRRMRCTVGPRYRIATGATPTKCFPSPSSDFKTTAGERENASARSSTTLANAGLPYSLACARQNSKESSSTVTMPVSRVIAQPRWRGRAPSGTRVVLWKLSSEDDARRYPKPSIATARVPRVALILRMKAFKSSIASAALANPNGGSRPGTSPRVCMGATNA
mmetsp:Transcript_22053/g.68451  ORF Transcript_22053/g.68451 Transcript_22053/m.68451 type:complete len:212 (-) Transcript_22053:897-1532(-)